MNLTPKQRAFADFYIELGNATEAARRAGYSAKTAKSIGAENLTKPDIKIYIARRQEKIESERTASLKEIQELRTAGDILRDSDENTVAVLGSTDGEKVSLLCVCGKAAVKNGAHAGKIIKELAAIVGGGGGGRPDSAQAGGKKPEALGEALAKVKTLLAACGEHCREI